MPASAACALLVAGLCIQAPYDRVASLTAMFAPTPRADPVVVGRLGVRIEAAQGDDIRPRDPANLASACEDGTCVLYLKTCAKDGLTCEYDWGRTPTAGAGFYTLSFWLTAISPEAMRGVEQALSIQMVFRDRKPVSLPVSDLSVVSPLPYLAPCGEFSGDAACVNVFYGRVPVAQRPARPTRN